MIGVGLLVVVGVGGGEVFLECISSSVMVEVGGAMRGAVVVVVHLHA